MSEWRKAATSAGPSSVGLEGLAARGRLSNAWYDAQSVGDSPCKPREELARTTQDQCRPGSKWGERRLTPTRVGGQASAPVDGDDLDRIRGATERDGPFSEIGNRPSTAVVRLARISSHPRARRSGRPGGRTCPRSPYRSRAPQAWIPMRTLVRDRLSRCWPPALDRDRAPERFVRRVEPDEEPSQVETTFFFFNSANKPRSVSLCQRRTPSHPRHPPSTSFVDPRCR